MTFSITMEVRDSECDLQGIVNNSVYQIYLEHCRHKYLLSRGIDFAKVTEDGINLVVIRIEIDYKSSLKPGDEFEVSCEHFKESKLKFGFHQVIKTLDGKPIIEAKVFAVALNKRGRPFVYTELD